MDFKRMPPIVVLYVTFLICIGIKYGACGLLANKSAILAVDASAQSGRKIPDTLFGIFFEVNCIDFKLI
jgi:alpha-L-arabinofuranosidase